MSEELKDLIERIRSEGVAAAEAEAEKILAGAKARAATIVREAEAKARDMVATAEAEARTHTERSRATLLQAARDLLLSVSEGVENIMQGLVAEAVRDSLDTDCIRRMLIGIAQNCELLKGGADIAVLAGPEDVKELVRFFAELYKRKLAAGIELRTSSDILRGFRIAYKDKAVYLDFTEEAVAQALTQLLRPHLAEIVTHAARFRSGAAGVSGSLERAGGAA